MPNYCYNKIVIRNCDPVQIGEWYKGHGCSRQVDFYKNDRSESNCHQVRFYQSRLNENVSDIMGSGQKLSYYELKRLVEKGIPENSVMQMTCPVDGELTNQKCIEKWGTKWDFNSNPESGASRQCDIEVDDEKIIIQGDTAWEPPIEWLKHIQDKFYFQDVECHYYEDGMEFAGRYGGDDDYGDDDNRFEWKLHMDDDALHYLYQEAESQETEEDEINTRFFDLIENHFRCKLRDEFCGDDLEEWEYHFFIDDFGIEMEMERYLEQIKPNMLSLQEKMERLEKLEDQLEKGEITEGVYLEECNKLK